MRRRGSMEVTDDNIWEVNTLAKEAWHRLDNSIESAYESMYNDEDRKEQEAIEEMIYKIVELTGGWEQ